MARLNSSEIPSLDEDVISKLHARNIFSVYDFMSQPCEDLMRITGTTFKRIEETREFFLKNFGGEQLNTLKIHDQEFEDVIPIGLNNLDSLLQGGLHCRYIYEICGAPSAGKSQLCHWISARVTQNSSAEVHYIDTSKNFCASRIQMILEAKQSSDEIVGKVMSNIRVYRIISIYDLLGVLHNLADQAKKSKTSVKRIIIIDSLPILFSLIPPYEMNRHLSNVASVCRFIVNTGQAIVVIVNSLRTERDRTIFAASTTTTLDDESSRLTTLVDTRPSLGTYWQLVPNVRLLISRVEDSSRREISLWKSMQLTEIGKKCNVEIVDGGFLQVIGD
ncbi:hypothetical protein QAD02_016045 [Eretmocerus hayati]|uniref:Uncharacterized protein n=1 Tax=Eretmocerus hayati TaxID=131215 RepID=A0ACC2P9Y9_9HYME|nr:hypothetical protein QAD02_016045 [Eretmocerus hayati]